MAVELSQSRHIAPTCLPTILSRYLLNSHVTVGRQVKALWGTLVFYISNREAVQYVKLSICQAIQMQWQSAWKLCCPHFKHALKQVRGDKREKHPRHIPHAQATPTDTWERIYKLASSGVQEEHGCSCSH
ncbi:hypothetical protein RND71_040632 [Anisodus tanguticus]|uniref:Uncharacterized protein n=1 Tax=Anisodus tanguticus TaxID=243964 RepID=A0AAE1QSZ2_9SOLA|nr:hypothetical protein RND71_040632 [Anisodus tanguticus]